MDSISLPKMIHEALSHLSWRAAIEKEMIVLNDNGTWTLVNLPAGKKAIACKWVFAVKVNLNGPIALKTCLVAKEYTQTLSQWQQLLIDH